MPGFVYYLPNRTRTVTVADLRQSGLGYAFEPWDGARCTAVEVARGPDGSGPGVVVADPGCVDASLIGFYPDKQRWVKVPGVDAHVGWRPDQPPTPADLARPTQIAGHAVRLGDGGLWQAPVARSLIEQDGDIRYTVALPTATGLDDDGNWAEGHVVERYKPLWELACRWWDAVSGAMGDEDEQEAGASFTFHGINDAALSVLAVNYRVGRAEVGALGLFDSRCVYEVMNALVDLPALRTILKKKADQPPESPPEASGAAAVAAAG